MGAAAPIFISGDRPARKIRVDHPSMTIRRSSAKPRLRCGAQHDRLLPSQQARQHRMPAGRQMPREIGGHRRQGPRQDVGEDQIVAMPAQPSGHDSRRRGRPAPGSRPRCRRHCDGRPRPSRRRCRSPAPGGAAISPRRSPKSRCRCRCRADGGSACAAPVPRAPSGSRGSRDARRCRKRSRRRA